MIHIFLFQKDVVSGIPTTSGTVPAAIITDPSSSTGSYLIVNQNGVPIVRPVLVSNMPESGMNGSETLQVLATGVHGMEGGDGQETVTVEVSAHNEATSAGKSIHNCNDCCDHHRLIHPFRETQGP